MTTKLEELGGYSPATDMPINSSVVVTGPPGVGKTHFYLTGPSPIVIFDVDKGLSGVVEKFLDKKDITVFPVDWPSEGTQADYRECWNIMSRQCDAAIAELKGTGTIVFDTYTELRGLAEWAFCGKPIGARIAELEHSLYQAPLRAKVRMIHDARINGVYVHWWGDKFRQPGVMELKGWKAVEWMVDVSILIDKQGDLKQGARTGTILKCRSNGELQGLVLPSPTFETVMQMVHG